MNRRDSTLAELADLARLLVRAGYLDRTSAVAELSGFVRAEVLDEQEARELTERLIRDAEEALAAEQDSWPERTDNDRLAAALAELSARGYLVREYVTDHFAASAALQANPAAVGIVFFTDTDVWHAISEGMLELKVWHADTSNVVSTDPELALVLDTVRNQGLPAVFDEGRIEVTVRWQRRAPGRR